MTSFLFFFSLFFFFLFIIGVLCVLSLTGVSYYVRFPSSPSHFSREGGVPLSGFVKQFWCRGSVHQSMTQLPPHSLFTEDGEETEWWPHHDEKTPVDANTAAITGPSINLRLVARLCRRGAPEKLRAAFWKLLIGFLPLDASCWDELRAAKTKEYRELVRIVCALDEHGDVVVGERTYRAVDVDIPRTMPSLHFFNTPEPIETENGVPTTFSPTQQSLRRIIHTLAGINKGLGYVQGMNELVGHLLYSFTCGQREAVSETVEGEVFFCSQTIFTYLGDDFCRNPGFDQETGVMCTIRNFERLLQFLEPALWEHLEAHQVRSEFYAYRWVTLLFTQEFNVPDAFRVWDFLLSFREELRDAALYVAVSMLSFQQCTLLRMNNLSELLPLLHSYPPCDVNDFLKIANGWIKQYGFHLVARLRVASAADVMELQRQYNVTLASNASWGSSVRGWVSSIKDIARYVSGGGLA